MDKTLHRRIVYLGCSATVSGNRRRADAYEHDREVAALKPAFVCAGWDLVERDWRTVTYQDLSLAALALVRTTWDYQDYAADFQAFLKECPCLLANSSAAITYTLDKAYMMDLAARGLPVIPTSLFDRPLAALFDQWAVDELVIKPRIGASGEGQYRLRKGQGDSLAPDPALIAQPFQSAILSEGEYSFIFIGGAFSHAVQKTARSGEYRIQSLYGGQEVLIRPSEDDVAIAARFAAFVPQPWLAVRVDMVRNEQGQLWLMELETIEPYLYPVGVEGAFAERFVDAALTYMAKSDQRDK